MRQAVVHRIERAHSERPYCDCGRETTVVYRDAVIWLECATVHEPVESTIKRVWNAVAGDSHVREAIVEIGTAERAA